jgi:hypothetical protein
MHLVDSTYVTDPSAKRVSTVSALQDAPPSVENSTTTGAMNVEERLIYHVILSGTTPVKSNTGVVSDWATVPLVMETQFGADRGALWLIVTSGVPGLRFIVDSQPAGRRGGEVTSKFSAYGKTLTCPGADCVTRSSSARTAVQNH